MHDHPLRPSIERLWEERQGIGAGTKGEARDQVEAALEALDRGELRVAEPTPTGWVVHDWLKKAVLLSFRLNDSVPMPGNGGAPVYDKVPLKTAGWGSNRFAAAGFRAVPGAVVRRSAYVAPGVILMPSFVNVGAYVGEGTMVDTWATVGSCAQVGKNCHLSGGVGLGGVLEPLQANPTIIEDDCFIGARSEVVEGVIVERGRCWRWACSSAAPPRSSTATTGEVITGRVPPYSVVVPGTLPGKPCRTACPARRWPAP